VSQYFKIVQCRRKIIFHKDDIDDTLLKNEYFIYFEDLMMPLSCSLYFDGLYLSCFYNKKLKV